jgi:hypothetical protein
LAERFDLVGEGLTSTTTHTIPYIKTHWPERTGRRKFSA